MQPGHDARALDLPPSLVVGSESLVSRNDGDKRAYRYLVHVRVSQQKVKV